MNEFLLIYTDPHHGLDLRANTTPASRKRLDQAIQQKASDIVSNDGLITVCAGDFYHRFSNNEDVLVASAETLEKTDFVLGGNHDVMNDSERMSSLGLMKTLTLAKGIIMPELGKAVVHSHRVHPEGLQAAVNLVFIPHHSTRESFAEALTTAYTAASEDKSDSAHILFLHCNYDCPMSEKDTEMNLDHGMAATLLEVFDFIFIGHDHNPKEDFDGRLVVIGSMHPTNFGDCVSSKRFVTVGVNDSGSLQVNYHESWNKDSFIHVEPGRVDMVDKDKHQFIRVSGKVTPAEVGALTKQMKEWLESPTVFAVKADLKVVTEVSDDDKFDTNSESETARVTDIITRELQSQAPELLELWKSLISLENGNA